MRIASIWEQLKSGNKVTLTGAEMFDFEEYYIKTLPDLEQDLYYRHSASLLVGIGLYQLYLK